MLQNGQTYFKNLAVFTPSRIFKVRLTILQHYERNGYVTYEKILKPVNSGIDQTKLCAGNKWGFSVFYFHQILSISLSVNQTAPITTLTKPTHAWGYLTKVKKK